MLAGIRPRALRAVSWAAPPIPDRTAHPPARRQGPLRGRTFEAIVSFREQEGSKQPAIEGGEELRPASETAGRAALSHVELLAGLAWHARNGLLRLDAFDFALVAATSGFVLLNHA